MTDKQAYSSDRDVQAFTHWIAEHALQLPIKLNFKSTRFVLGGLRKDVIGLPEAVANYAWKSKGTEFGNWAETSALLRQFRARLQAAIAADDNKAAFCVSVDILEWGGDHNPAVGAQPFLRALADEGELVAYLAGARSDFSLHTAQLSGKLGVRKMNSMLTKVHALASDDGLPIYDSRVAAAIASLVEIWRRAAGRATQPLPALLTFPATESKRTVRHLFDAAEAPGQLLYGKLHEARTVRRWAEAKIRLGWLMQDILALQPEMFGRAATTHIDRMHALEASLFMVGYDVACLKQD
jgi:hypothetical protein